MSDARPRSLRTAGGLRAAVALLLPAVLLLAGCAPATAPDRAGTAPGTTMSTAAAPPAGAGMGADTQAQGTAGASPAIPADAGAPAPGASSYPVPSGALFVAPDGSDAGPGTERRPLRTVTAAVKAARNGQTVVVRAGSYHESITVPEGTRVTLQPYPGEEVWLEGSRKVSGFVPLDGSRFSAAWEVQFDSSPTYTWGAPDGHEHGWRFLDEGYPLAAHPDQVWLDGQPLRQVGNVEELDPGSFHVDYAAARLTLGVDPAGRSVRASALAKALSIRSEGTVVRGLGIRRYAPSVPHMGAVTVERPNVVLEALTIRDNATTGLSVGASGMHAYGLSVSGNGMLGITATYADGLRLEQLKVSGNNREHFRHSPVAGGIKIARSRDLSVRGSKFTANHGTGLWLDESVRGAVVSGNVMRDNSAHGFSAEISADVDLVDNLVAGNGGAGAKINNTSRVRIWNNTFTGNGRELNIVQDPRRADQPNSPGRDPRRGFEPEVPWISGPTQVHNNIFSGAGRHCLLCVEDYSRQSSAEELGTSASGNAYQIPESAAGSPVILWSGPLGSDRSFRSAADFAAATGQEEGFVEASGALVTDGALSAIPAVAAQAETVAIPLPADLAALAGRPPGARHLGAFVTAAGTQPARDGSRGGARAETPGGG